MIERLAAYRKTRNDKNAVSFGGPIGIVLAGAVLVWVVASKPGQGWLDGVILSLG